MKTAVAQALVLASLAASATAADCGPDKLGTSRTITLKREGAAYGAPQHAPLQLAPGEVVLTFDDGPAADSTPLALQALSDQCAKATFFLVGQQLRAAPELARREVGEGHSAGLHSDTHAHLPSFSVEQQLNDLKLNQAAYKSALGIDAPAYRFPFLEETPALLDTLRQSKLTVFSVDLGITDWMPDDTTPLLAQRLSDSLDKAGRGIILMHDAHMATAQALPTLLKVLKDKGYKVVHVEWEKP